MQEKISYLNKLNIQNNKSKQKNKEEYKKYSFTKCDHHVYFTC